MIFNRRQSQLGILAHSCDALCSQHYAEVLAQWRDPGTSRFERQVRMSSKAAAKMEEQLHGPAQQVSQFDLEGQGSSMSASRRNEPVHANTFIHDGCDRSVQQNARLTRNHGCQRRG